MLGDVNKIDIYRYCSLYVRLVRGLISEKKPKTDCFSKCHTAPIYYTKGLGESLFMYVFSELKQLNASIIKTVFLVILKDFYVKFCNIKCDCTC